MFTPKMTGSKSRRSQLEAAANKVCAVLREAHGADRWLRASRVQPLVCAINASGWTLDVPQVDGSTLRQVGVRFDTGELVQLVRLAQSALGQRSAEEREAASATTQAV